jgi:hypothetical protein
MSIMNTSGNAYRPILPIGILLSFLLLSATSIGTMNLQGTNAQNATTTANQTGAATTQNQTTVLANLTNSDFDPIRENLAAAREAMQDDDPVLAYRGLGWADNEVFILAGDQGSQTKALLAELKPVQDDIQKAQEAILQGNNATILNELGSAEVALLQVTQKLPAEDTEEPEEEPEETTGGG